MTATAAIEMITSESLMRWNWGLMETAEHVAFVRKSSAHFAEAFKGVSDEETLQVVRDFLRSPKAKRYLERKAVWEAYWAAPVTARATA